MLEEDRGVCGVDGWSEADGVDEGCWGVWSATSTTYHSSPRARNTRSLERMDGTGLIRRSKVVIRAIAAGYLI